MGNQKHTSRKMQAFAYGMKLQCCEISQVELNEKKNIRNRIEKLLTNNHQKNEQKVVL